MRALKRRLSDIVFRHMVDDAIAHTVTATLGSDMRTYTSRAVQPTVSMCSSPSSAHTIRATRRWKAWT